MYYDKQEIMAEITLIIKSKEKKINKYNALKKKAVEETAEISWNANSM